MNPPFEKGADADYVAAAFRALAPGGILVAARVVRILKLF